jgi:hypothetical protein
MTSKMTEKKVIMKIRNDHLTQMTGEQKVWALNSALADANEVD